MPAFTALRRRLPPVHRLALRLAGASGAVVAGGLAVGWAAFDGPGAGPAVLLVLLVAVAVYGVAHTLLAGRLRRLEAQLDALRGHRFEAVGPVPAPRRDELDALSVLAARAGRALARELDTLRRADHYRRDFLGDVSHELKTPIFAIQGFAETLLGGALHDERVNRAFVEKILRHATRLDVLTRDLAEVSRIESGALRMHPAVFELPDLVREVLEALEPLAAARGVALDYRAETLPAVVADRERVRQVLTNLVDNAIRYNHPGGWVRVETRPDALDAVAVTVRDNGIGVAPDDLPRLTERFFRADRSRSREQGGTGLGLAIVKHILGAHGRALSIESAPGEGSTFAFTLPADRSRNAAGAAGFVR